MVKYLIQRPIAVFMAFTACFIVALASYFSLPVSLLPNIAIPEITVQITAKEKSAQELEDIAVKPIRRYLMQVNNLRDIRSETKDGAALIRLNFEFGTNTDLAFIEVNEKIDGSMNVLPREIVRPRVIKASATDLPVFYLNLTMKQDSLQGAPSEDRYLALCRFAESVIKRRIEQLPEVAMVDVTGVLGQQVQIIPDEQKLISLGLTLQNIESILKENNVEPGSMKVRDGYYEYNIRFSSLLRSVEDIQNIYLKQGNRLIQLKELASVTVIPQQEKGYSLLNGQPAVTMAVIKQSDETIEKMKQAMQRVTGNFESSYPDIRFTVTRNQTELLDLTIDNLKQNLSLGFLMVCFIAFIFLGDVKSPLIIGISMVVSLVISLFFFYLFHTSLNIVSICGLILALGMMIDSAIIVTENITRYRESGLSLDDACDRGTTDVITPMLSSALTTIAVFVPLVFLSGIAGAIFFDQAFAVTIGLLVSYMTGIMLLPVLYKLVYGLRLRRSSSHKERKPRSQWLENWYDRGVDFTFRHKAASMIIVLLTLPLCVYLFFQLPKERMPHIDRNELSVKIEWNENIHIEQNRQRVEALLAEVKKYTTENASYVGQQQYLLKREEELSSSESEIYLRTHTPQEIEEVQSAIQSWSGQHYPRAVITFSPPETVFEKIFTTGEADIVAEFAPRNRVESADPTMIRLLEQQLSRATDIPFNNVPFEKRLNISIDYEKLLLYGIDYNMVQKSLRTAFKENEVTTLRSHREQIPITIAEGERRIDDVLQQTLISVQSKEDKSLRYIPLSSVVSITPGEGLKHISSGKNGSYIPFSFYGVSQPEQLMKDVRNAIVDGGEWDVHFTGGYFFNNRMINELAIILLISILLMYFILASQFESFVQPLIVLIEIPIDIAAALALLWLCGHTLNLMSAIGIVVTCGIIINDSILKIDVINTLRREGLPIIKAVHRAGQMRLRAIIMTSLTTIFALVPVLFTNDIGSALQKPLAIAMIGSMTVGTLVSLFIIPLVYWFIYRNEDPKEVLQEESTNI